MHDFDALVRRADEDRWLASRFAPRAACERLMTIYALNYEIARAAEVVREPQLGAMRLAWWREAIAEIHEGARARAPVLEAYAQQADAFSHRHWNAIIDARAADFEATPFSNWAEVDSYIEAAAGGVMRLALAACGACDTGLARPGALAWGYVGLLRAAPFWAARGRAILPEPEAEARARAAAAYGELRQRRISAAAFPALGYVALTPAYLRGAPTLFTRQLHLVWASATGRV